MPCADYITNYPFKMTFNVIYNFDFTITVGYNKIFLPQPIQVNRGHFLKLTQTTGRVALDKTSNPKYCDLVWNSQTQWTEINSGSNWRFYISTISSFTSYFNSFNINHKYSTTGIYPITLTFLSSNQVFTQVVNITDCKLF